MGRVETLWNSQVLYHVNSCFFYEWGDVLNTFLRKQIFLTTLWRGKWIVMSITWDHSSSSLMLLRVRDPDSFGSWLNKLNVKIICLRGWRDGSVVKNATDLPEDLSSIFSTHIRQPKTACNTNARGFHTFWPLWSPACNAYIHMHMNSPFERESVFKNNREA